MECVEQDSDPAVFPQMRYCLNAWPPCVNVCQCVPRQDDSDLPLPVTSWYHTLLALIIRKEPRRPFGDTFTWPSELRGAEATQKTSCSSIHRKRKLGISSKNFPMTYYGLKERFVGPDYFSSLYFDYGIKNGGVVVGKKYVCLTLSDHAHGTSPVLN